MDETRLPVLALFDLDGVLIQPGGYRAAVKATINYFSRKLGLGEQTPLEEDLAIFEANGISSEWDMVPICVAILIDRASLAAGVEFPDCSFQELTQHIQKQAITVQVNYRSEIARLSPFLKKPGVPAAEGLSDAVRAGGVLHCGQNAPYMTELLGDTRHIANSETMRVFQNFILGDSGFTEVYGFRPEFACESYLKAYDGSLLDVKNLSLLQGLISCSEIRAAVITARPSMPPAGASVSANEYSPEAEMALKLTGLSGIPLIGYGTIQFLAGHLGLLPDSLIKPSPVQALAAIGAAFGADIIQSLEWAVAIALEKAQKSGERGLPPQFILHIFEDSPIGIQACQRAAAILRLHGVNATIQAWGIASNPDKKKALEAVGAAVFPDVNLAIAKAFPGE